MDLTVFYSWQSVLPNTTNRTFILNALERATKNLRKDENLPQDWLVDRDTLNVPGSPHIAQTILDKIDRADVFVADLSVINPTCDEKCGARKVQNPNVCIEFGYAQKSLGQSRLLIITNSAYGTIDDLPFDLKTMRIHQYRVAEDTDPEEKAKQKAALVTFFEEALRAVGEHNLKNRRVDEVPSEHQEAINAVRMARSDAPLVVGDCIQSLVKRVLEMAPNYSGDRKEDARLFKEALDKSIDLTIEFSSLAAIVARMGNEAATLSIFEQIPELYTGSRTQSFFSIGLTRFIAYEWITILVGHLLRRSQFPIIAALFNKSVPMTGPDGSRKYGNYRALGGGLVGVYRWKSELDLQYIDPVSEVIKERFGWFQNRVGITISEFRDADILLYLRSVADLGHLEKPNSEMWVPGSMWIEPGRAIGLMLMAQDRNFATLLKDVLNRSQIDDLKTLVSNALSDFQARFQKEVFYLDLPLGEMPLDRIGTR